MVLMRGRDGKVGDPGPQVERIGENSGGLSLKKKTLKLDIKDVFYLSSYSPVYKTYAGGRRSTLFSNFQNDVNFLSETIK